MPKVKCVVTATYHDSNLCHKCFTGRSVTGVLHFLNNTPVDWHSDKQAKVEIDTYGPENYYARTCIGNILDLRITLRYIGAPIR